MLLLLQAATPVRDEIKRMGATKFLSLIDAIKLNPDGNGNVYGTFMVPSNAAVDKFLKDMGLTEKDLAARPELVDLLVSYHFMPRFVLNDARNQVPANTLNGTKALTGGCLCC